MGRRRTARAGSGSKEMQVPRAYTYGQLKCHPTVCVEAACKSPPETMLTNPSPHSSGLGVSDGKGVSTLKRLRRKWILRWPRRLKSTRQGKNNGLSGTAFQNNPLV